MNGLQLEGRTIENLIVAVTGHEWSGQVGIGVGGGAVSSLDFPSLSLHSLVVFKQFEGARKAGKPQ